MISCCPFNFYSIRKNFINILIPPDLYSDLEIKLINYIIWLEYIYQKFINQMKKIFISIEGNIGSGKSTFLNIL